MSDLGPLAETAKAAPPWRYAKEIGVAALTVLVALRQMQVGADLATFVQVALLVVGAAGTIFATNAPSGIARYSKAIVPAITAALTALAPLVIDGDVSWSDGNLALSALLVALTGYIIPNDTREV